MNRKRGAVIGVVLVVLAILAYGSFYTVKEGEQVLVVRFGDLIGTVAEPGLQFKVPLVDDLIRLEKRLLQYTPDAEEVTLSDPKRLEVSTTVMWRIDDPVRFYQTLGTIAAAESRIQRETASTVRNVLRRRSQSDVLSPRRLLIMEEIREIVSAQLENNGIVVADVRIVKAELPAAITESVLENMRTERQQEAAAARARGQRDAEVTRAVADRVVAELLAGANRESERIRGDADNYALTTLSEAYGRDEAFFSFYYTLNQYVDALAGSSTQMVMTSDSDFLGMLRGLEDHVFPEPTLDQQRELQEVIEATAEAARAALEEEFDPETLEVLETLDMIGNENGEEVQPEAPTFDPEADPGDAGPVNEDADGGNQ